MSSNHEITLRLASRLKDERKEKGLSLDALAKLSGVSRSMLSQIERGESSPTVASLWNLTRALNVDFAELLDEKSSTIGPILDVVRGESTPVIHNKTARCLIRILSAPEDVGDTEVYDIHFEKGASLDSSPHKAGCVESLTVLEGRLEVTTDDQSENVTAGDTIRYVADKEHAIRAPEKSRAILVVKNA
ncbi:helix-turn-helix domain-containing protein [Falsihalocynthiibacter sp. S25ZX9]|uniref:XRE family transcriptional regulator n=1 Tax=Falsihalocynthiibacter arcticus TaxID=1579316 RepID=A0A126V2W0_9RHOB|nr:XRE family transcriptional regulator [Falsihalocynthiibacter arcticus]AML52039.1 XRE family transcriptional regulator [Falsihalocynthiibacter arcticus]